MENAARALFSQLQLLKLLKILSFIVLLRVLVAIVAEYKFYFPPDFSADFLREREDSFFGLYALAFYVHIITSPFSLLNGLFLINERLRARFPTAHKGLGWLQIVLIGSTSVSGLAMSFRADTGWAAGSAFATLSFATLLCTLLGLRAVLQQHTHLHQIWMTRSFVLLSSAVVLRLLSGLSIKLGLLATWTYPLYAWISWLLPLGILEIWRTAATHGNSNISPPSTVFSPATVSGEVSMPKK